MTLSGTESGVEALSDSELQLYESHTTRGWATVLPPTAYRHLTIGLLHVHVHHGTCDMGAGCMGGVTGVAVGLGSSVRVAIMEAGAPSDTVQGTDVIPSEEPALGSTHVDTGLPEARGHLDFTGPTGT